MTDRVFLDASFWVVYREEREAQNPAARKVMDGLLRQRARFVTTLPVICETHAYFARDREKRELVLKDFADNPLLLVEPVSDQDQRAAFQLLRRHSDKSYSLCDALSFVVMRRLQLRRAASFDNHFRQIGEFEIIC